MSGGLDSTTYDLGNAVCGLFWAGLAGVKPGDDGFDGEDGNQLGGPVQPRPGRYLLGQVVPGHLGGGGGEAVGKVAEFRFPRAGLLTCSARVSSSWPASGRSPAIT
jgi:hypothetical protein